MGKFEYIKADTTGFEEKIKKAWEYYKEDINSWTENFKRIYKKFYYENENDNKIEMNISKELLKQNKNIQKLQFLYNKGLLDAFDMFLFINSTKEDYRRLLIDNLLNLQDTKSYKFIGVPHYAQMPALINEFNERIEKILSLKEKNIIDIIGQVKKLQELSNIVSKITDITNITTSNLIKLKNKLEEICQEYCRNGIAKFTSALFYLNPENFIPINRYTSLLFDTPSKYTEYFVEKYINLCKQIKEDERKLNKEINEKMNLFVLISAYAFYSKNVVGEVLNSYKDIKNIVLTGAPGTGKTYSIKKYLKDKLGDDFNELVYVMQFHPNIEYSDFIEGIQTHGIKDGVLNVKLQNGAFKEFCKKAFKNPNNKYYFVIDEINRANLSSVFGEILNALEYRIKFDKNGQIKNPDDFINTQYTNMIQNLEDEKEKKALSVHKDYIGKFGIPENLYILATMNDVDKSIDSFDLALRRRFVWIEMEFDENVIRFEVDKPELLIERAKKLNNKIINILGSKAYEIGHAYFLNINKYKNSENKYNDLWNYHLKPLIKEYLRSEISEDKIDKYLECLEEIFVKNSDKKDCDDKNS